MNILILNWKDIHHPMSGGAEIVTYELGKRMVKDGHNVVWFASGFKGCKLTEEIEGIKIVRKGNRLTTYLHAYFFYKQLKEKPDLTIDMINTICWQTPLYTKNNIAYINQFARKVLFYELPPILSHIIYLLETYQYKTYKKTPFICYSNSTKEELIELGFKTEDIDTFNLGLDKKYTPGKKADYPLFLFVGRLNKMKRPDLCINAMSIVIQKYPVAKLAIIGLGNQKEKLKNLIKKLGVEDNIFFIEEHTTYLYKNSENNKVKFMQESWATLVPSVKEGWCMVVTESNACGTPAIGTNVSGLKDSIINNKTGLLISSEPSKEELAETIVKLIEDKNLRADLSANAIKWSKHFSWDKSYKEFKKVINRFSRNNYI